MIERKPPKRKQSSPIFSEILPRCRHGSSPEHGQVAAGRQEAQAHRPPHRDLQEDRFHKGKRFIKQF